MSPAGRARAQRVASSSIIALVCGKMEMGLEAKVAGMLIETPPIGFFYLRLHESLRRELEEVWKVALSLEATPEAELPSVLLQVEERCVFLQQIYKYHSVAEDEVLLPSNHACFALYSAGFVCFGAFLLASRPGGVVASGGVSCPGLEGEECHSSIQH